MRIVVLVLLILSVVSCSKKPVELKTGVWRGVITLQNQQLPFTFDVEKKGEQYLVHLNNASEKLLLDEITVTGDSVKIQLHIFDAALHAKIEGNTLTGTFIKNYFPKGNLPFTATFGDDYRYAKISNEKSTDFSGKYQLEFNTGKDTYASVGIVEQTGNHLTGTFLTPMGDYRYLEGNVINDQLWLSTFDGNHAFVFTATLNGDSLKGDYYSGHSAHETFKGIKNENILHSWRTAPVH